MSRGDPHQKKVGKLRNRAKSKMAAMKMHAFTSRLHMKVLFIGEVSRINQSLERSSTAKTMSRDEVTCCLY